MVDIIFFDLDGTLTDPKEGITNCVRYALRSVGIDETNMNRLMRFIGPPLKDSFMEFYGFCEEDAKKLTEKYRERFSTVGLYENSLYDGVSIMLKTLKDAGKTIVLATAKPIVFAKRILEHFDIAKYFDLMCGAELDGSVNHKHEVISLAIVKLNTPDRTRIIMVGDRKQDIEGAKMNKIKSVGVSFGYAEDGELETAGADYISDSMNELTTLLLSL